MEGYSNFLISYLKVLQFLKKVCDKDTTDQPDALFWELLNPLVLTVAKRSQPSKYFDEFLQAKA